MSAFFARKQGGTINILKLQKLLYLADRESMRQFGAPISFDNLVSLDHGPVLSRTLNLMNGGCGDRASGAHWEEWISDRSNYDLHLKRDFSRGDLDQLSDADLDVMESVWSHFGHMDKWTLRDYTHQNCPEWQNPNGSALPITDESVFLALGVPPEQAVELGRQVNFERQMDALLAKF